jgi:hypothetical protein
MSTPRLRGPSPALVVSIIALVVACTGTATAATLLIRSSKQVANGAINSGDLANRKAVNVVDLTPAARRALGGKVGPAGANGLPGSTGPVGPRGETGPTGSVAAPEAFREVGTPGSPAFENGWKNYDDSHYDTAAFYKDPLGVVHLKGTVGGGPPSTSSIIFTLPVGYRPAKAGFYAVAAENEFADLLIQGVNEGARAGRVELNVGGTSWVSLSGITFRAAS